MRRLISGLLLASACLVSAPPAVTGAPPVTSPESKHDTFYRVPEGVGRHPNGEVLDARRIEPHAGPLRAMTLPIATT